MMALRHFFVGEIPKPPFPLFETTNINVDEWSGFESSYKSSRESSVLKVKVTPGIL